MEETLLDTDMLSEILKGRHAAVVSRAALYLRNHGRFAFSIFTRFEIERGYRAKGAAQLEARFAEFCDRSLILSLDEEIFDRAADLWATARRTGASHSDADLLIAATALTSGRVLATGNRAHFAWIPGLTLVDWRADSA